MNIWKEYSKKWGCIYTALYISKKEQELIRALAQGCVTGNCDEALQSAAAIAIEGLGARRRVETNEHVTLHMD